VSVPPTDAFFLPEGEGFVATEWTRGPWSAHHQHAGPPSALLARAIERLVAGEGFAVTRMTLELLSPIPIAPLSIETSPLRAGRTVQRIDATLSAGDRALCRATGLALRMADVALPPVPIDPEEPSPPPPEASPPFRFPFFVTGDVGYHTSMEGRLARGVWGQGAVKMWMRPRVALVAGETSSPLQRVMISADSGNGVAVVLDPARYTFMNADLTVALHRPPDGDWVCLDAMTRVEPRGVGLTTTRLWDARGRIGIALQTLVVAARDTG
jgi:hypothetical protein